MLGSLNVCSQKGLVEMFDSSIGASTVMMPYGGKYQQTEIQTMVAKLPVLEGKCDAVTMMSYGFDPYLPAGVRTTARSTQSSHLLRRSRQQAAIIRRSALHSRSTSAE